MRHVISLLLLLACGSGALAQHLGSRQQWQPQIESDPRLQQQVEIEILGRAAVTGLPILSEKTGVSLSVAPEDLSTVGERRFSVFAHGCPLKDIMVQVCEALQECHWDVDWSGEQPVYLLHRNAGADLTALELEKAAGEREAEQKREQRLQRLDEARQALKMTPEQLAELEKADPLLARSVRDPHSRDLLEIVLSLPEDQMRQLNDTGEVVWRYTEAPERLQKAVQRIAEWYVPRWGGGGAGEEASPGFPPELVQWRDHLDHATIALEDNNTDHGWGVWLSLLIPVKEQTTNALIHDVALQPRYCNLDEGQPCYTRLLVATGVPDEETAFNMTKDMDHAGFAYDRQKLEQRRQEEWVEPTDPTLLRPIALGDRQFANLGEVQQFIAKETGISVISDYFTGGGVYLSDDLRKEMPLWRLLYLLGEDTVGRGVRRWRKAGSCLAFRHEAWYALARGEVPESLLLAYREKLKTQGQLSLDDIAAFVADLGGRRVSYQSLPEDLAKAGLTAATSARWHLAFYASLSPEQIAKARTDAGLAFSDMSMAQRQQVIARAAGSPGVSGRGALPAAGRADLTTFHVVEALEERRGTRFAKTELQLRFPERPDRAVVLFRKVETPAAESGAPKGQ